MKKILVVVLLMFGTILTGCTEEPIECEKGTHEENGICVHDEIIEVVCMENQVKSNDVCINLSGPEIQLRNAINHTKDITTYRLTNHIVDGDLDYIIEIAIDESITHVRYDMGRTDEYFRFNDDGTCEHMTIFSSVSETDTVDCSGVTDYTFFKQFDYTWFELVSGKYELKSEFSQEIDMLFDAHYDDFEISNFKMSVADGYISEINYSITMNEVIYHISMEISSINDIEVLFGGVSE